jgi:hypothetical protein
MHIRKKIMIQVVSWAVWLFMICSWAIIKWQYQPPLPLAYNLLSLIAVFYACRWMAAIYWKGIAKDTNMSVTDKGLQVKYPNAAYYIMRWPFFGMVGIVFAYIILSWYVDGVFALYGLASERTPDFYFYTYASWNVESLYVCGGNIMAAIEYHFKKEAQIRAELEEDNKEKRERLKIYDNDIKTAVKRITDEDNDEKGQKTDGEFNED